jgi:exodeoxyribonuclease-3
VRRLGEQAALVAAAGADVVALQEVTRSTAAAWRDALAGLGLDVLWNEPPPGRRLGVLTAARALEALPGVPDAPWPERVLCTRAGEVEVVNLHSPIAPAPDLAKVRTHEAVAAYLAERSPCVLCGDLNTPRRELPDGDVLTFAHDSRGRLRAERGERWNRAERALVKDLGWIDAYRELHGYGDRSASWTFKDDRGGWRLDHILVTGLRPIAAAYAHEWRRAGLSDHSALIADLEPS